MIEQIENIEMRFHMKQHKKATRIMERIGPPLVRPIGSFQHHLLSGSFLLISQSDNSLYQICYSSVMFEAWVHLQSDHIFYEPLPPYYSALYYNRPTATSIISTEVPTCSNFSLYGQRRDPARDGQSITFRCSRTVPELKFSILEFRTRSYETCGILAELHDEMHNKFIQSENSVTKHAHCSATNASNLDVAISTQFQFWCSSFY